jgi:hypothetical protein
MFSKNNVFGVFVCFGRFGHLLNTFFVRSLWLCGMVPLIYSEGRNVTEKGIDLTSIGGGNCFIAEMAVVLWSYLL